MPGHPPQLPRQLGGGSFAIGACDGSNILRERPKVFRRKPSKQATRDGVHYMDGTRHFCFRTRNDGDCACGYRLFNEILTIESGALKCSENGPRRNFTVVNGKTGDGLFGGCTVQIGQQLSQPHYYSPFAFHNRGISSETSTSRFISGIIPSKGPMRVIVLCTTGAAV